MNERIKAIGRQAGFVFIEDGVYGQRWYSSKCGLDAAEYEKLVKMIVQECLTIADKEHKLALEFEWDNDDTAQTIKDGIKKHFGVAE
jgi:hypothetical protein